MKVAESEMFGASLQSRESRGSVPIGRWWLAACVGVIAIGSLTPAPGWPLARHRFFASLLLTSRSAWLDAIANVGFYLPLGLVLSARGVSRRRIFLAAA